MPAAARARSTAEVTETAELSAELRSQLADPLLLNAAHYAAHSSARSRLTLGLVHRDGNLLGAAPLLRLVKYRGTRLLEPRTRRWIDPVAGPFARQTTCMIDGSFMAFRHASPFVALDPADEPVVRDAVVSHVKADKGVDALLISEPANDGEWSRANGFMPFLQLPLVAIDVEGCQAMDDHLARIGQKRRRNLRKERQLFEREGGTFEVHAAPVAPEVSEAMHACLLASSAANSDALEIPFEDLMNSRPGLFGQEAEVIVARVDGEVAGFFSFIVAGDVLAQCHGGLDYDRSLRVKAYPNLIHAATELAIERRLRQVTLGPLNNEAKRRAGALHPVMASHWVRSPLMRSVTHRFLLPKFQVYGGPVDPNDG